MQDKNYTTVKSRLNAISKHVNAKGIRGLSSYLNVKESTIYAWINRESIGDIATIVKKIPHINIDWLETGTGAMLLPVYPDGGSDERPMVCEASPQLREDQKRILQLWDKLDCDGKAAVLLVCKAITKQ